MPLVISIDLIVWLLVFVWGGAAFGAYTMTLTEIGKRFIGASLVAGNAALGMTWGVSSIVGVPITGSAMQFFGTDGYVIVIGAVFAFLSLVYLFKLLQDSGNPPGKVRRQPTALRRTSARRENINNTGSSIQYMHKPQRQLGNGATWQDHLSFYQF